MKKAYTKPEIIFDDFSLANTIAAGCTYPTHTPSWNMCGIATAAGTIFNSSVAACDERLWITDDGSNGYCYDVPTADAKLFNSL